MSMCFNGSLYTNLHPLFPPLSYMRTRRGKVVFNTYGRSKNTNLRGGDMVEENLYTTNDVVVKSATNEDEQSMQSIELAFTGGGAGDEDSSSQEVGPDKPIDGGEDIERLGGMDVKINLAASMEEDPMKDTAL